MKYSLEDAADLILTALEYAAGRISEPSARATVATANMMTSNEALTGPTVHPATIEDLLVCLRHDGLHDQAERIEAAMLRLEV